MAASSFTGWSVGRRHCIGDGSQRQLTIVIGPPPGEGRNNARAGHGGPPTRGLDCVRTSVTKEGVFPVELNGGPAIGTSRQAGTMARATSAAPAARNYFHSLDSYSRRPRASRLCALGYLRRRSAPVRNGHGQSTERISTRARARRSARNIMSRCMASAGPDRVGVYRPCRPEVT